MRQKHLAGDLLRRCIDLGDCRAPLLGAAVPCRAEYTPEIFDRGVGCNEKIFEQEIASASGEYGVELRRCEGGAEDGACAGC